MNIAHVHNITTVTKSGLQKRKHKNNEIHLHLLNITAIVAATRESLKGLQDNMKSTYIM
jgi:hypothetical protein